MSVGISCFGDSKLTSKPESEELESSSKPPSLQKEYSDDIAPTVSCCNAKRSSTFTLIPLYESKFYYHMIAHIEKTKKIFLQNISYYNFIF